MKTFITALLLASSLTVAQAESIFFSTTRETGENSETETIYVDGEVITIHRRQIGGLSKVTVIGSDGSTGSASSYDYTQNSHYDYPPARRSSGYTTGNDPLVEAVTLLETQRLTKEAREVEEVSPWHYHWSGCEHDEDD